jgi:hypothetical protein
MACRVFGEDSHQCRCSTRDLLIFNSLNQSHDLNQDQIVQQRLHNLELQFPAVTVGPALLDAATSAWSK